MIPSKMFHDLYMSFNVKEPISKNRAYLCHHKDDSRLRVVFECKNPLRKNAPWIVTTPNLETGAFHTSAYDLTAKEVRQNYTILN